MEPDIVCLYHRMSQDHRLQLCWEANQPRTDRALEAGLNCRVTREVATAILLAFKLAHEPAAQVFLDTETDAELLRYARTCLGPGGARLVNLLTGTEPLSQAVRTAALTSLRFYRHRPDPANELVRLPWSPEGLENLSMAADDQIVAPVFRVPQADRKAAGAREVACLLREPPHLDDADLHATLLAIPSLGPERATVVGVFGFRRGWPITDNYLWCVLQRHGLLTPEAAAVRTYSRRQHFFAPFWQQLLAAEIDTPDNLAANLHLWACEVGRFEITYTTA